MTTYAAYDENSIYALGQSPEAAIKAAREAAKDDTAQFKAAPIDPVFAAHIEENGFDGMHDAFDIVDGTICPPVVIPSLHRMSHDS